MMDVNWQSAPNMLRNNECPILPTLREVAQIDQFLQETAAREANAKVRLQQFIEELLDRADRAEKQLQIISSCGTTPNGSLGRCSLQASKGNGRQVRERETFCAVLFSAFAEQQWPLLTCQCPGGIKQYVLLYLKTKGCMIYWRREVDCVVDAWDRYLNNAHDLWQTFVWQTLNLQLLAAELWIVTCCLLHPEVKHK